MDLAKKEKIIKPWVWQIFGLESTLSDDNHTTLWANQDGL